MDARWRRSEKEEKKVKKQNSDDVEMVDEYDADSSPNQMTTKARTTKRMKKPMKMRMKKKKEAERRERNCNVL